MFFALEAREEAGGQLVSQLGAGGGGLKPAPPITQPQPESIFCLSAAVAGG